jgi:hypothetical protein
MDDFGIVERRLATASHPVPLRFAAGVIAIAWTLHNPAVTVAIVGGRNAKQVEGVIPAMNFRLPEAQYAETNEFLKANPNPNPIGLQADQLTAMLLQASVQLCRSEARRSPDSTAGFKAQVVHIALSSRLFIVVD